MVKNSKVPQVCMGRRRIAEDKIMNSRDEQIHFTSDEESGLAQGLFINKFHPSSNCPSVIYFLRERNICS
jgi:hypothetical protein